MIKMNKTMLIDIREINGKNVYFRFERNQVIVTETDPRLNFDYVGQTISFKHAHFLKCIQPYFDNVTHNRKRFEIRLDDRDYKEGDFVVLREYNPKEDVYSGRVWVVKIVYLIRGTECLKEGYCAFTIEHVSVEDL